LAFSFLNLIVLILECCERKISSLEFSSSFLSFSSFFPLFYVTDIRIFGGFFSKYKIPTILVGSQRRLLHIGLAYLVFARQMSYSIEETLVSTVPIFNISVASIGACRRRSCGLPVYLEKRQHWLPFKTSFHWI